MHISESHRLRTETWNKMPLDTLQKNHENTESHPLKWSLLSYTDPSARAKGLSKAFTSCLVYTTPHIPSSLRQCFHNSTVKIPKRVIEANI